MSTLGKRLGLIGLAVLGLALVGCGDGATPANCSVSVPPFEFVNATRYEGEVDSDAAAGSTPTRIFPSQFGSLLIPDRDGDIIKALPGEPRFATFGILLSSGEPKSCDTNDPCGGTEICEDGRCMLETRYFAALSRETEQRLVEYGYFPSPNTLVSSTPEIVVVERCGDEGVNPDTCTDVLYESCFTNRGAPGPGL